MSRQTPATIALAFLLGACTSCGGEEPTTDPSALPAERTAPAEDLPMLEPATGGVSWRAPEPLVYRRPQNEMRAAEYTIRDHTDATLIVSHFPQAQGGGGDVQQNVDRWLGQFEQPGGGSSRDAAEIETREVNGLRVTLVEVRGTFVGRIGMGGPSEGREGWRLLGAVVEGPQGLVFFKLIGQEGTVGLAEDAFSALVDSLRLD